MDACARPSPVTVPRRERHGGQAELPLPLSRWNADLGGRPGTSRDSCQDDAPGWGLTGRVPVGWEDALTPRVHPPAAPPTVGAPCSSRPPRLLRGLCNSELGVVFLLGSQKSKRRLPRTDRVARPLLPFQSLDVGVTSRTAHPGVVTGRGSEGSAVLPWTLPPMSHPRSAGRWQRRSAACTG